MQTGLNSEIFSQLWGVASALIVKIDHKIVFCEHKIFPRRVLIGALSAFLSVGYAVPTLPLRDMPLLLAA